MFPAQYVPRHTLGLNRMADWTDEEYSKLALGHLRRENGQVEGEAPAASNHVGFLKGYSYAGFSRGDGVVGG